MYLLSIDYDQHKEFHYAVISIHGYIYHSYFMPNTFDRPGVILFQNVLKLTPRAFFSDKIGLKQVERLMHVGVEEIEQLIWRKIQYQQVTRLYS